MRIFLFGYIRLNIRDNSHEIAVQIHQLQVKTQKAKRRIGRGGKKGTYSGRGMKGQKARSGAKVNPIFEGGRSTLIEHLPKMRGFKSIHPKNQVVSLEKLDKFFQESDVVSPAALREKRLIRKIKVPVKILGNGEIGKKVTVEKCLVSKSAREKIESAGGSCK
jgi:large subunit ribosomal protein L15